MASNFKSRCDSVLSCLYDSVLISKTSMYFKSMFDTPDSFQKTHANKRFYRTHATKRTSTDETSSTIPWICLPAFRSHKETTGRYLRIQSENQIWVQIRSEILLRMFPESFVLWCINTAGDNPHCKKERIVSLIADKANRKRGFDSLKMISLTRLLLCASKPICER